MGGGGDANFGGRVEGKPGQNDGWMGGWMGKVV